MAQPYVGEIRMFGGNFAPAGWMFCEGQLLPISENETLFNLIGTTYGGDGQQTFGLPDLRGRLPVHQGSGVTLAQTGGVETVTLTTQTIPTHSHPLLAANAIGNSSNPQADVLAESSVASFYHSGSASTAMDGRSVGLDGGSQPHTNLQPFLCVDFIISLFGIFPSQN